MMRRALLVGVLFAVAVCAGVRVHGQTAAAPILLVVNGAPGNPNPYGPYLAEVLKAEGINAFDTLDLSAVTPSQLTAHSLVVLAETPLTPDQAATFEAYITGGGRFVTMRPDPQILPALGLAVPSTSTSEGYIAINTGTATGAGFPTATLPFHGTANNYGTLGSATTLASLYSDQATATAFPAVVRVGQTVTWAYDVARSVVYSRQGDPANAGVDRDGLPPLRTNDVFYNAIDKDRVSIPHADVQMRLFARVISDLLADALPLPQLWYFPGAAKTLLVVTADSHANPQSYFDAEVAAFNARNIKASIYINAGASPSVASVQTWRSQGHEVGMHPAAFSKGVTLDQALQSNQDYFTANGYGAPSSTSRIHQVEWLGWVDGAKLEANHGVSMDTSFYTWGPAVIYPDGPAHQAHGYINGSGQLMRFVDQTGAIVPTWGLVTSLVDEQLLVDTCGGVPMVCSEQLTGAQALAVSQQLIDASQAGNYAAVMTQFHVDYFSWPDVQTWALGTMDYANALGIPNRTAEGYLNFTTARAASAMTGLNWSAGARQLAFSVTVPAASEPQSVALPGTFDGLGITGVTVDGVAASASQQTITGRTTAFVSVGPGTHTVAVVYNTPIPPPEHPPAAHADSAATTEGVSVTIPVLANDSDPDGDPLTGVSIAQGTLGLATINLDQTVTYVPTPGHCGTDTFTYTISDGRGGTASAPVTVGITCLFGEVTHNVPADFGVPPAAAGAIVTLIGDGEVRLAGVQGDEYSATTLNGAEWAAGTWSGGALTPVIAGGVLSLGGASGAYVRSVSALPVTTVEFTAQFTGAAWEHVGWAGLDFADGYLLFSTFNTTNTLFVRTGLDGAPEQRTSLGTIPSGFHTYRIDRIVTSATTNAIRYYVDGVLRAEHAVGAVPASMYVYQSHNGGVTPTLDIDRIWTYPLHVNAGSLLSPAIDSGGTATWTVALWDAVVPAGTTLDVRTRTSPDAVTWSSWSSPMTISGQGIQSPPNRYLQYLIEMTSLNPNLTPIVDSVTMRYGTGTVVTRPPLAVNDSAATVSGQSVVIPVLANDSSPDGTALTVASVTQGASGSVSINPDQTVTYTSAVGTCGPDTFTYTNTNGPGGTSTATVSVAVSCLRGVLTHTTAADFIGAGGASGSGVANGTIISRIADGEVRLAGTQGDEFSQPSLNTNAWVSGTWAGGAYAPVPSAGVLSIAGPDGVFVRSANTMPVTTLEASVQFTGAQWEHVGWASQDFCCDYLIFSTFNTTSNLFARSHTPTGEVRTDLGPIPSGFHIYRIDRRVQSATTDAIDYLIDGTVVATHTVQTQSQQFVYLSHAGGVAPTLNIDRVWVYPSYVPAGTFQSAPMDSGVVGATWTQATWSAAVPASASLQVFTRTSPDGLAWSPWAGPLTASGSAITSPPNRYIQYELDLATNDPLAAPVIDSVSMRYSFSGSVAQATAADFGAASVPSGTLITQVGDGEVRLAGVQGDEFAQPVLDPAQWVAGTWAGGAYTPALSGGVLSIAGANGAFVRSAVLMPVTTFEASVRFSAAPWEHVGWGSQDFCCDYLIFSTAGTTTNLYARSHTPSGELRTDLGPIPSGFHVYRIERQPTSATTDRISYFIDGVLRAQHDVQTQPPMFVYISHNGGVAPTLDVDRAWVYPSYIANGSFVSGTMDSGVAGSTWTQANWSAIAPAGTSLLVWTRTSSDGVTWSDWAGPLTTSGSAIASPPNRYLQYRLDLATGLPAASPVVDSVVMSYVW